MPQRVINILNDLDCVTLLICLFLGVLWFAGEPDLGDAVIYWITDGELTCVETPEAVEQAVEPEVEAAASSLDDGTDPFANEEGSNTDWLVKPVPITPGSEALPKTDAEGE